jgi:hypothetical protein
MKVDLGNRRMVRVLMSTLEGTREIEVDDEGNNKDLQLHVNLDNLKAIEKSLETLKKYSKEHQN